VCGAAAQPSRQVHGALPVEADVELVGEADGTVKLDGQPRQPQGHIGAARLGAAGQRGQGQLAALVLIHHIAQAGRSKLDLDVGVHHAVLQGLVRTDGLAKLDTRLEVGQRHLVRLLRNAQQLGGLRQPRGVGGLLHGPQCHIALGEGQRLRPLEVQVGHRAAIHTGQGIDFNRLPGLYPAELGPLDKYQPAIGTGAGYNPVFVPEHDKPVNCCLRNGLQPVRTQRASFFLPRYTDHAASRHGVGEKFVAQGGLRQRGQQRHTVHTRRHKGLGHQPAADLLDDAQQLAQAQAKPTIRFRNQDGSPAGLGDGAPDGVVKPG